MSDVFPKYRKYPNNKSFFKVLSNESFEEIQVVGSNYLLTKVEAKILPDRHFIADMIESGSHWVPIEAEEYLEIRAKVAD
jgi:hypothetical protein